MFNAQFECAINKIENVCKNLDGEISRFSELLSSRLELDNSSVQQHFTECIKFLTYSDEELAFYFKNEKDSKKEMDKKKRQEEKLREKEESARIRSMIKQEKKEQAQRERYHLLEKKKLEKLAQKEATKKQKEKQKKSPSVSTIASNKFDWIQKPVPINNKDNAAFWLGYNLKIEGQYYHCSMKTKFIYQVEGTKYYLFGLQELENECILEESLSDEIKIWAFASNFVVSSMTEELINRAYAFIENHRTELLNEFDDVEIN